MTSRSSKSSGKETKTIAEFVEGNSNLPPVWKYNSTRDLARPMPKTPLALVWFGVVFAVGLYPIVVGVCAFAFEWLLYGMPFPMKIVLMIVSVVVFSLLGAFCAMLVMIPAHILLKLFGWVSGGVISERGESGVYGGLTGFLCTTGGGLFLASGGPGVDIIALAQSFVVLPLLLAIVMGHVGAIWAGYRNRDDGFPFFEPLFAIEQQFTIAFLMKLTVFVAVLAVICKAAGNAGLAIGILWAFYFVVQGCLLLCDHWIQKWMSGRSS